MLRRRDFAIDAGLIVRDPPGGAIEGLLAAGDAVVRAVDRGGRARELLTLLTDAGVDLPGLEQPPVALIELILAGGGDGVPLVARAVALVGRAVAIVGRMVARIGRTVAIVGVRLLDGQPRVPVGQAPGR